MSGTGSNANSDSRRTFLKIGTGFVVGAVVAGAGVAAYESSVIGGNNSSSSSAVESLSSQLSDTQAQLAATQGSLNDAQSTISTLTSQLSSTQGALGDAQSSISAADSQNATLSQQLSATQGSLNSVNQQLTSTQSQLSSAQGQLNSANVQISTLNGQVSSLDTAVASANSQVTSLQGQVTSLQGQVTSAQAQASSLQISIDTTTAFQTLGVDEQSLVEAIASTIIPTDSNGPGATTAGVVYFIDGQLAGKYGASGHMYMQGPFVQHDVTASVTIAGTPYTAANGNVYTIGGATYSAGTMATVVDDGQRYQYAMNLRSFWHDGLLALETYANSAYGANFETLSPANQVSCLQDLANNKPTTFSDILPQDFFYEIFSLVWSGFLMDPMYGGNRNMIGWQLTGFNGLNQGNFYGEGMTTKQLMVSTSPIVLKPASLGQFQKGSP